MSSGEAGEYTTIVKVNAKRIKDRYSLYITIPKPVAEKLGLRPGNALQLTVKGNTIILRPLKPVD